MKFRNNYSCLKLFHSISVIFISVVVQLGNSQSVISSKEESNLWNLENLLGEEEYGTYFRGYDILLGGTLMEGGGGDNNGQAGHREVAMIPLKGMDNNGTEGGMYGNLTEDKIWKAIEDFTERNGSLVVLLSLENLEESLEMNLNRIKEYFVREIGDLYQKPFFFLSYDKRLLLNEAEENKLILSREELAKGLEIDSDVYLVYWKCSNDNDKRRKSPSRGIPSSDCPSGLAESKTVEFFSSGEKTLIVQYVLLDNEQARLTQKVIRRTNLKSAELKTIAAYGYPHRANFTLTNDSFSSGYEAEQIKFLGEAYNFSVRVGVAKGWIDQLPNHTLTGMGAQVIGGEADISISASEMLTYRVKQLAFLHPTYYTKMWGFFVQPPSSSFRDIFIHAFTGDLWLTMFSTWILIVLAMGALALVKRRLDTMHDHDHILMQELLIWAAGAICQQGWHICPESTCMKIIFIFALITGLVSYVAYSAALVSILSVKVVPIKNLDDIVSHSYKIYEDNQTINTQYVIQKLEAEGRIPCMAFEERSIRSETALGKILAYGAAFIGASDFFYPVAKGNMSDTEICNLIARISISGRPIQGGMFIRKGSPLKDFFNHKLLIMYERGVRFRLLENYFRDSSVMCLEKTGATKDPLGFNDVYTAFVILLLGYCLSFLIFVVELIFPPHPSSSLNPFRNEGMIKQQQQLCIFPSLAGGPKSPFLHNKH